MELDPNRYYVEFAEACAEFIRDRDCTKYFKRYEPELPRITTVLGMLRALNPASLLDIGSGRGRALWPILYSFPKTEVLCIDQAEWRCEVINAVHKGGVQRVQVIPGNIIDIPHKDNHFEVVTALEVLEHIPLASEALQRMMRLARRFVIITVPSKPDNNPEHIHFFNQQHMLDLIEKSKPDKKITKIQVSYVRNSMIVLIGFQQTEMANVGTYSDI